MVKKIGLKAKARAEEEKSPKQIRITGSVPAVIYGAKFPTQSLTIKRAEIEKVYRQAGESSLVDLGIDDAAPIKVLIKDVQKHSLTDHIEHADFYVVDMKKPIEVEIPLHFTGESKAEKELGGVLIKTTDTVHVKCLPGDLIDSLEVDISGLLTFADAIRYQDLKLADGMELLNNPEDQIVHVIEHKEEIVEEAPVAPVEGEAAAGETKEGEVKAGEAAEGESKTGEKPKEAKSGTTKKG